jgi:hypothetical protein
MEILSSLLPVVFEKVFDHLPSRPEERTPSSMAFGVGRGWKGE